ncbi:hypothetical protein NDU88_002608 [Pleurodeles waltl]|uniref:Uncharacterized protein n=1 Tax=Pleurodeles waltl TaxID=8319 RepID=A0AAV7KT89_PLEWA|nr:hypothetical protein NDU88_002608 [Pleurodeles waltl]
MARGGMLSDGSGLLAAPEAGLLRRGPQQQGSQESLRREASWPCTAAQSFLQSAYTHLGTSTNADRGENQEAAV